MRQKQPQSTVLRNIHAQNAILKKAGEGRADPHLPSLTDATQTLLTEFRKVPGGFTSTDYLASLTGWPTDFTERTLRILERDKGVYQTPDGLWRLVK